MMSQQASAQDLVNDLKGRIQQVRRLSALPIQELVLPNGVLDQLAHHLAKNLKATQLRRVFHDLKRLEQDAKRGRQSIDRLRTKLALTLPELAYAYGREVIPREFYEFMRSLLHPPSERFQDKEDVQRLVEILTALLAYHKFHERKER